MGAEHDTFRELLNSAAADPEASAAAPRRRRSDFFQLVRRVDALHSDRPRIGESPVMEDDPVLFGQPASLVFATSTIDSVDFSAEPPTIFVNAFGLLGPNGPMPLAFTEYAHERALNNNDPTLNDFTDVLTHRLTSLFYRAWASGQPAVSHDRPDDDTFATWLSAVAGEIAGAEPDEAEGPPPLSERLYFSGWLSRRTRSAEGLAAIIGERFDIPVGVTEFIPSLIPCERDEELRLGHRERFTQLGRGAMLGSRAADRSTTTRLTLGPLPLETYDRLTPGGDLRRQVDAWIAHYTGGEVVCEVQLVLERDETPRIRISAARGIETEARTHLGWTTWLGSQPRDEHPDDLIMRPILRGAEDE